jgi:hypothetical protein
VGGGGSCGGDGGPSPPGGTTSYTDASNTTVACPVPQRGTLGGHIAEEGACSRADTNPSGREMFLHKGQNSTSVSNDGLCDAIRFITTACRCCNVDARDHLVISALTRENTSAARSRALVGRSATSVDAKCESASSASGKRKQGTAVVRVTINEMFWRRNKRKNVLVPADTCTCKNEKNTRSCERA